MANFFKPRRGKKATAILQNIVLKRGEVFFEVPDSGVGTGKGKIKMGDGTRTYEDLPYFYDPEKVNATTVGYDNEKSQLKSENLQDAVDEVSEKIDHMSVEAKELKTNVEKLGQMLNGITLWYGTKEEYEALINHSPTTLYLVKDEEE